MAHHDAVRLHSSLCCGGWRWRWRWRNGAAQLSRMCWQLYANATQKAAAATTASVNWPLWLSSEWSSGRTAEKPPAPLVRSVLKEEV